MTGSDMAGARDAPWDETDDAILRHLALVHTLVDPPPPDLDERVRFAIAVEGADFEDADFEVARLREDMLVGSGARSTERPRSITFDSESLTVMVTVVVRPDGHRRVDGWLAPPAALRVELRTAGGRSGDQHATQAVTADDTGRFVFDRVRPGMAQLLIHGARPELTVVTSSVVL